MFLLLNFFFFLTYLHISNSEIQLTQNAIQNWNENNITDIAQYSNLSQFIIHDNPKLHDYVQIGPQMFAVIYGLSNQDISVLQFINDQGQTISTKEFITIKNARDNIQISQTQVENEVFYAVLSSQMVYYGFSSHLSQTTRNCNYEQISMYAYQVQVKTAFDRIYLIIQGGDDDLFLHYIDISDASTYQIYYTEHLQGNGPGFRYFKFSFQVYSDNSGIIIGNSWAQQTEVYQYPIETTGDVILKNNKFNNSFLDSIFNQYTQFNFKKNVNSDQHTIVLGHESSDILKIYTGKMISNELQQLCLSEYTNISDISFKYLQFGILDTEYLWIKGEYKTDKKTVILFTNPSTCNLYTNQNNQLIKYDSQFENGHIFHTYSMNQQIISIILYGKLLSGLENQFHIITDIFDPCVFPCATCQSDNVTCATCVDNESLRQLPDCDCPNGYFNEFYINECQECSQLCETCIDYNTCTSCSNTENSVGTPSCQCLDGFYLDNNFQCQDCPLSCETCIDYNTCLSCKNGFYLNDNFECQECQKNCKTCNEYSTCLICKNQILMSPPPNCECQDQYFFSSDVNDCLWCYTEMTPYCIQCDQLNGCTQCYPGFYLDSNNQCKKCDVACGDQGCNSQDECNNCIQNYLLINGHCIQNPYICQECKQIIQQYNKLTQYQKGFYYEFYQQNNIECPPNYYKCLDQQKSQDTIKNCYEWKYMVNLLDLCINSKDYTHQGKI